MNPKSEITQEVKKNTVLELKKYCAMFESNNTAASTLSISPASLSNILTGKWDNISDSMWRNLNYQITSITGDKKDGWKLHRSKAFQELTFTFYESQKNKMAVWAVGEAGCGKTTSAKEYRKDNKSVYYVLCAEDMHRGDFIGELFRAVGAHTEIPGVRGQFEAVLNKLNGMAAPLLIFDEADKLSESVFSYFVSIYNRLEGRSGMVFLSTAYIKRRMEYGLAYNKKGYAEMYSRIGRRFLDLTKATEVDIYSIAQINGLTDQKDIKKIIDDAAKCDNDLRRVKQTVSRLRRLNEIQAKNPID